MGLRKRGGKVYFYECERVDGRPRNRLVAKGAAAELLAGFARLAARDRADEAAGAKERRERRAARRRGRRLAIRAEREELERREGDIRAVADRAARIAGAALVAAGLRKRKGEWRRPRGGKVMDGDVESTWKDATPELVDMMAAIVGVNPRAVLRMVDGRPSLEVLEGGSTDPATVKRHVAAHFEGAEKFDPKEAQAVRNAFEVYRALPPADDGGGRSFLEAMVLAHGGDATARAEDALIRRSAELRGGGLYCEQALRIKLAGFKASLLGEDPTDIERAMVDSVACCYLDACESEERSARAARGKPAMLDYLERRKARATKRYHDALRALALVRSRALPNLKLRLAVRGSGDGATAAAMVEATDPRQAVEENQHE